VRTSSSGSVIDSSIRARICFSTRVRYVVGGSGVSVSLNMCSYRACCTAGWTRTLPGGRARCGGSTSWKYCTASVRIESAMASLSKWKLKIIRMSDKRLGSISDKR
jgi:hypothetical protein